MSASGANKNAPNLAIRSGAFKFSKTISGDSFWKPYTLCFPHRTVYPLRHRGSPELGCQIPISKGSLLMLVLIYHSGEINAIEKFGKCQNLARIYTGLQRFTLGGYPFLNK